MATLPTPAKTGKRHSPDAKTPNRFSDKARHASKRMTLYKMQVTLTVDAYRRLEHIGQKTDVEVEDVVRAALRTYEVLVLKAAPHRGVRVVPVDAAVGERVDLF